MWPPPAAALLRAETPVFLGTLVASLVKHNDEQAILLKRLRVQQRLDVLLQPVVCNPQALFIAARRSPASFRIVMRIVYQVRHHKRIVGQLVVLQVCRELLERNDVFTLAETRCRLNHTLEIGKRIMPLRPRLATKRIKRRRRSQNISLLQAFEESQKELFESQQMKMKPSQNVPSNGLDARICLVFRG
jgi:hypothetical protein